MEDIGYNSITHYTEESTKEEYSGYDTSQKDSVEVAVSITEGHMSEYVKCFSCLRKKWKTIYKVTTDNISKKVKFSIPYLWENLRHTIMYHSLLQRTSKIIYNKIYLNMVCF